MIDTSTRDSAAISRRNYAAILLHGVFGETGFRLMNAPTFLPAYIYMMSGSEVFVGVALAAQHFGSALSSIPGGTLIEYRQRVLPVMLTVGMLMRSQILTIALAGFLLPVPWALGVTCASLLLFGLFNGMQAVIFPVILSKLIPVAVRGRMVGIRNALAGLVSSGVALAGGSYFIEAQTFGNGYATTLLCAFGLTVVGLMMLALIHEPLQAEVRPRSNVRNRFREIPALLASDKSYTAFVVVRALAALGMIAAPYYVVFAGERVGLTGGTIGYFTVAFLLASTLTTILWGLMADRLGNRVIFGAAVVVWGASALFLLIVPGNVFWLSLVFAGLGAGVGGFQIAGNNMILEFGTSSDLPLRIAISFTANTCVFALAPLIGGLLTLVVSFGVIFALATAFQAVALSILWVLVDEPRHRAR